MPGTNDIVLKTSAFNKMDCGRQGWIVLLYARRVPPHVGLLINGNYNSLTVKGPELNVSLDALMKLTDMRKIETVFIKVIAHPVFSIDYQLTVFQELVKKYKTVKQFEATCLNPIKDFFQEFYAVEVKEEELLSGFLARLNENSYLESASSINFDLTVNLLEVPVYNAEQLHEKIKNERLPFYAD